MSKHHFVREQKTAPTSEDGTPIPVVAFRRRLLQWGRDGLRDAVAGGLASIVLIANIVSFGALMFPGALQDGVPIAIWAMLIGSCVGGIWIACTTSLPPLSSGIDSPTGVVLALLSAGIGSSLLRLGSPIAVESIMLAFTAATVFCGLSLWLLGVFRCGSYLRFAPSFVVGGFLAATGVFLIGGGLRMTTGHVLTLSSLTDAWSMMESLKLGVAVAVLLTLLSVRLWFKSAYAMPIAILALWLAVILLLRLPAFAAVATQWYFPSLGQLIRWSPLEANPKFLLQSSIHLLPELIAVSVVALISLVTKVSALEVARRTAGDLDREFRSHGIANLLAAPFGGIVCSLQTGTSRLLEHAGSATRLSGAACSVVMGIVGISNFDLLGVVPIPIVAGLVFFLGYVFLVDALGRPLTQRAWFELVLVIAIMSICLNYGYLVGVLAGLVAGCLLFAISYSRVGVIRRHLSRAQFASYVDRPAEAARLLRERGEAIQIYWLWGYIFFGSSEGVFERIRSDIGRLPPRTARHVVLDFGTVTGADSSAGQALTKLRNFCRSQGVTLVYSSLSQANLASLRRAGFFGRDDSQPVFANVSLALEWCENALLSGAGLHADGEIAEFGPWLQHQIGESVLATDMIAYFECREVADGEILYRQGEPADRVDVVAAGSLVVDIATGKGDLRVRRMTTRTVLGEMGFFRRLQRSATVSADGPVTLFSLTRGNFERMRRERPELAVAFEEFIIRTLADRLEFANQTVTTLSRSHPVPPRA